MDITPILEKIWKALELRLLVLLSLIFQVVLIFSGNRRRYTKNKRVAGILWLCYLSADYVATFALGILSQAKCVDSEFADQKKHTISVFWAPFLLIHLGGPDTITAYAMADNELWLRHVLGLISQLYVALYVYLGSFTPTSLNFLWLVIFFAGVIKYGERSWVLYSASKDRYRSSLISQADPGPNYPKFVDEATSREEEGYKVTLGELFSNDTTDEERTPLLSNSRISDNESLPAQDDNPSSSNTRISDIESLRPAQDDNPSSSNTRILDIESLPARDDNPSSSNAKSISDIENPQEAQDDDSSSSNTRSISDIENPQEARDDNPSSSNTGVSDIGNPQEARDDNPSSSNTRSISDIENPQEARDDNPSSSNTGVSDSGNPQEARDNNPSSSNTGVQDSEIFAKANFFFGTFKKLFADLILSFQDREDSISYFENLKCEEAFKIVEIELGLVYDLFYTKSSFVFSRAGVILRVLTCSSTIAAFVAFLFIQEGYPQTEVIVTYVLLLGAITLEMYAILLLFLSERMVIWLGWDLREIYVVSLLYRFRLVPAGERWSKSVGQYNVFDHCLRYMPKPVGQYNCFDHCIEYIRKHAELIDRFIASVNGCIVPFRKYLDMKFRWESKPVEDCLKELIYEKMELDKRTKVDSKWINHTLKDATIFDQEDEIEFDQSILIWHMATDICYHTTVEGANNSENNNATDEGANNSKIKNCCVLLSNYMVHLLITSPFMLPSGIGQIRFQDTCAETAEFFDNHKRLSARVACKKLSEKEIKYKPSRVKGDRSKSVLFEACGLAAYLGRLGNVERWKTISKAWLDMLLIAAAQCSWSDHADKLNQGGELLTHVWLLMAHFGMTDQFQISKGHIRAKLVLE